MPRRPRRTHSPAFTAKVAREAIKGEQTIIDIAERFDVHPNVITKWKRQLSEGAPEVFGAGDAERKEGPDVAGLHARPAAVPVWDVAVHLVCLRGREEHRRAR